MGVKYSEVASKQLISKAVMECLPSHCECGAETEFTSSLRQIMCPNRWCSFKIAARLESMAKKMQVNDFGESTCINLCSEFEMKSPYQVFLLEKYIGTGVATKVSAFDKKISAICDKDKRRINLWQVVSYGSIPDIDSIAFKIFDGYSSIEEAFVDIKNGQVPLIAEKLGIRNNEGAVLAVRVYNTLISYEQELIFGEKMFNTKKSEGRNIFIAITESVNGFPNKPKFISFLNDRYEGIYNFMLKNSVTTSTYALVADGDSATGKYDTAVRLNAKPGFKGESGEGILIMTSSELVSYFDKLVLNQ